MKKIILLVIVCFTQTIIAQDDSGKLSKVEIVNIVSQTNSPPPTVVTYDFTTSASKYYGGAAGAAVLEINDTDTTWGMIAGDADKNGGIGASDLITIRSSLGSNDYNDNDVDLNSGVGSSDLILIRKNLGKAAFELPE